MGLVERFLRPVPSVSVLLKSTDVPNHMNTLFLEVINLKTEGVFFADCTIIGSRNEYYSASNPPRQKYELAWIGASTAEVRLNTFQFKRLEIARIASIKTELMGEVDLNAWGSSGSGNVTRDAWRSGPDGLKPEFDLIVQLFQRGKSRPLVIPILVRIARGRSYRFDVTGF